MRSFQVFAAMSSDDAIRMLRTLADKMPAMFDQAVHNPVMTQNFSRLFRFAGDQGFPNRR